MGSRKTGPRTLEVCQFVREQERPSPLRIRSKRKGPCDLLGEICLTEGRFVARMMKGVRKHESGGPSGLTRRSGSNLKLPSTYL